MQRSNALAFIAGGAIALSVAGCSMPKHSNTLVFGTNTQLGISAGTDATSTPTVNVGYRRQEAVVMPLLANKAKPGDSDEVVPVECVPSTDGETLKCMFVGTGGDTPTDTYSVLASFGAQFGGEASSTNPSASASGGLAQYFATGLAARKLAEAGAALVATGDAATAAAEAQVMMYSATDPAVRQVLEERRAETSAARTKALAYAETLPTDNGSLEQDLKDWATAAELPESYFADNRVKTKGELLAFIKSYMFLSEDDELAKAAEELRAAAGGSNTGNDGE